MAMLHEQVGMRIGLTLTDSTLPTKAQVQSFIEEGLHRVQTLLDPADIWPLTRVLYMPYPKKADHVFSGINNAHFIKDEVAASPGDTPPVPYQIAVTGYAQIISVAAKYSADVNDPYIRATEVPAKDWDKSTNPNSMYNGTTTAPVFSFEDGHLVISPEPDNVKIAYIGTIDIDADASAIQNVPKYVESVLVNYATAQAAMMLTAHYAQEEDPIAQNIQAIAQMANAQYESGFQGLIRKSKIRGNIS